MKDVVSSRFDFEILDETADWIVLSKPAPLQIHPSKPADRGYTLWDGLRAMLSFELTNGGQISIINRLDRETSGVVLVAKSPAAARRFGKAMMRRQMKKTYLAIVQGWPSWTEQTIDAPIRRQGEVMPSVVWVKQMVHEGGVPCLSHFRVLHQWQHAYGPCALIEASPHTGRMHQLRVHLSHLGHPVVGDKLYGPSETHYLEFMNTGWTPTLENHLFLRRQALHSHTLTVQDTDSPLEWKAPLPSDLREFLPAGLPLF
ncbi:RluA family pseudouridine synthase [soil metagenome]